MISVWSYAYFSGNDATFFALQQKAEYSVLENIVAGWANKTTKAGIAWRGLQASVDTIVHLLSDMIASFSFVWESATITIFLLLVWATSTALQRTPDKEKALRWTWDDIL